MGADGRTCGGAVQRCGVVRSFLTTPYDHNHDSAVPWVTFLSTWRIGHGLSGPNH
ncbi:hypothetical protein ACFFX0_13790 [Citricoccus parietis]|uniref:Uncharacterized protein n=1 Tax=Citricoccus parietis TaxID=592307 RepID=A0ABV5FZV0_9MICC